jgi:hypothetical protein
MGKLKGESRLGEERLNNQGYLMKIVLYNDCSNIIVEFQDKYKGKVHTSYQYFRLGEVRNPYHPNVFEIGITGNKHPARIKGRDTKEYSLWHSLLQRCFDKKTKEKHQTYKDVTCCEDWLLFENFYEWLHNQENFDKWASGERWAIDKDILIKGNKTYSMDNCCLVPQNVNSLFLKSDKSRGDLPIGVTSLENGFVARCNNPITNRRDYIGYYDTPEKAFFAYKEYKEKLIKQVAELEYAKGNITKKCYDAMMNYEVEITD